MKASMDESDKLNNHTSPAKRFKSAIVTPQATSDSKHVKPEKKVDPSFMKSHNPEVATSNVMQQQIKQQPTASKFKHPMLLPKPQFQPVHQGYSVACFPAPVSGFSEPVPNRGSEHGMLMMSDQVPQQVLMAFPQNAQMQLAPNVHQQLQYSNPSMRSRVEQQRQAIAEWEKLVREFQMEKMQKNNQQMVNSMYPETAGAGVLSSTFKPPQFSSVARVNIPAGHLPPQHQLAKPDIYMQNLGKSVTTVAPTNSLPCRPTWGDQRIAGPFALPEASINDLRMMQHQQEFLMHRYEQVPHWQQQYMGTFAYHDASQGRMMHRNEIGKAHHTHVVPDPGMGQQHERDYSLLCASCSTVHPTSHATLESDAKCQQNMKTSEMLKIDAATAAAFQDQDQSIATKTYSNTELSVQQLMQNTEGMKDQFYPNSQVASSAVVVADQSVRTTAPGLPKAPMCQLSATNPEEFPLN